VGDADHTIAKDVKGDDIGLKDIEARDKEIS
jgi:hypothetical protein